jgi:PGF-CTERM protein
MTKRLTIALVALALFVLVAVMPASAAFYTVGQNVTQGATVFIGEQGLNITPALLRASASVPNTTFTIGWWASAAVITTTPATKTIDLTGRNTSFMVAPADFVGYTGNWYIVDPTTSFAVTPAVFSVADPTLDLRIWDPAQGADVSGKSITQGTKLQFRIDTNQYAAVNNQAQRYPLVTGGLIGGTTFDAGNSGYIDIKVKSASGEVLTGLYCASASVGSVNSLLRQNVSYQPWYWGAAPGSIAYDLDGLSIPATGGWATDALDTNSQYAYPAGAYTIWAESKLNNMKDNYKNAGADYTGKTVSASYTVTLVSDTVKIEANKDTVVRSKTFSVTVTGKPSQVYHIWVKGTSTMGGGYDDQPPLLVQNQEGVVQDGVDTEGNALLGGTSITNTGATAVGGGYIFQNSGGLSIWDDVAKGTGAYEYGTTRFTLGNGTRLYGNVAMSTSGTRTVAFATTNWTKAQKYTIRVEQNMSGQIKSDEVDVKVEKGAVTIVAAGDQSYYLGEEIKFSGTNTETQTTYMFIIGPNLNENGAQIKSADPRNAAVVDQNAGTFQTADVLGDNTWSWKWGTANVALDAGTYTVYAVSQPRDKASDHISKAAYGTVSIIIKKPFISATASSSTIAKGDNIFITGTAEGNPSKGVAIWILGKNYYVRATEAVNSDASFKYEVKKETTKTLAAGQYFVVVQHPMQNNQFDVDLDSADTNYVKNLQLNAAAGGTGTRVFKIGGSGSLQGSDAAEALVQAINDPNVDDTYTKLQFLVEEPVITVQPIGDKHVGDKFTITATTNLKVDDEVLVQVYSSSFKPTQKSQSGEFSGATGTVKVVKGDSGLNKITFDVDSSTFKPDEYLVTENAVLQSATGTALFNVLETVVTPVVTKPVTTAAVQTTAIATTVQATTVAPTPTPTKSPGYGALIALIGLGAVAFIVVRRH